MLLLAEGLIDCSYDDFLSHFTGKKFPDAVYSAKVKWYGSTKSLSAMFEYLAEMGFVNTGDVKVYGIIIPGISLDEMKKEHFEIINQGKLSKISFTEKLQKLFPAATAYRCKTRLFYKARNKQAIAKVISEITS